MNIKQTYLNIKRFLFGSLQVEIDLTQNALNRYKNKLYDLEDALDPDTDCCPNCLHGSY